MTRLDPKYLIVFLITLVLVVGEARYSILGGYDRLATTLGVCLAAEVLLSRLLRGRVANLASAYITGISLALLIKPQANILWPFALGAFLAIASKYVLTYRGRHLWNPSNFAIALLVLVAADSVAILSHQWGNDLRINLVIWAFGLAVASRAGVLHVTLTYVGCFVVLAVLRNLIVGGPLLAELAPITGPMYQLFVFFMVTDPRTTVSTPRGRMLVVASVAVVETIIRLAGDFQVALLRPLYPSPPILALAIVGPIAMWWDLHRQARRGAAVSLFLLFLACNGADPAATPVEPPPPPPPPEPLRGAWSALRPAPIVQLHVHLLTNGKVLSWGKFGDPQIWDPATRTFTAVPAPSWLFCAGHDFLPDGRLLVAGGHITDFHGPPNTNAFDPATGSWQALPAMTRGRWYPTNTTLPNGEVLTLAGTDSAGVNVPVPEVWNGTAWRQLTGATLDLPYYPRAFVAPDGRVFYAGEGQPSRYLDVMGTGHWTDGPLRRVGARDYGSAVMYEPGKILYVGGGDPPTNTAEIIDLNQPNPVWQYTGSMAFARRQMNATLLPTGEVLVTGGTSSAGFNNRAGALRSAEIWRPATGTWRVVASSTVFRIYHGAALLLPDGRVLYTGSGDATGAVDERNYETYSPPYLFHGPRPRITGTQPPRVTYGQTLKFDTPDAAAIAKVTLIRFSSVTHAFDQSARLVPLSFTAGRTGLSVAFPASRTVAPPGPYMLFVVTGDGVPSEARIVLLQ